MARIIVIICSACVANDINMTSLHSPPISITTIEKVFSWFVLGATFPKPTLVKLLRVKYIEVRYLVLRLGPLVGSD